MIVPPRRTWTRFAWDSWSTRINHSVVKCARGLSPVSDIISYPVVVLYIIGALVIKITMMRDIENNNKLSLRYLITSVNLMRFFSELFIEKFVKVWSGPKVGVVHK